MKREYFNYRVLYNWRDGLSPEMCNKNVFCYGKKKSGKTETIGLPYLMDSLQSGRSSVLYAENLSSYTSAIEYAAENGYEVIEEELYHYCQSANSKSDVVENWLDRLLNHKTLLVFHYSAILNPYIGTRFDELFYLISNTNPKEFSYCDHPINFVIDAPFYNFLIFSNPLKCNQYKVCYITNCEIVDPFWQANFPQHYVSYEDLLESYSAKEITEHTSKSFTRILKTFFESIEVVICTGISGVKPQAHKDFLLEFITGRKLSLSGKFALIERYESSDSTPPDYSNLSFDDVMARHEEYAKEQIFASLFVFQIDNEVQVTFFNNEASYYPLVFAKKFHAKNWLISTLQARHYVDVEVIEDSLLNYVVRARIYGTDIIQTLSVSFIWATGNLPALRESYLINVWGLLEIDFALYGSADDSTDNSEDAALDRLGQLLPDDNAETIIDTCPEEFRYQPYTPDESHLSGVSEIKELPKSGVLFLGGHINMTKKLRQIFPGWKFITDDCFKSKSFKSDIIFFWTGHSSHKMIQYVSARIPNDTKIIYVTATNLSLLIDEMQLRYNELFFE